VRPSPALPASAEPHSQGRTLVAVAAVQDFNYKIALASGLRELQAGRLRQAEQQFGYLCAKFPAAPGGYRGLAKVRMEQADRPGALTTLRDGAAKLAKAGEHGGVVALLNEALQLDPLDLGAHRRLAAAHALAGERDAAVQEYLRYARLSLYSDPGAAKREIVYGLDSLGAVPELVALANEVGIDTSSLPPPPAPAPPPRTGHESLPQGGIPGLPRRARKEEPAADPRLDVLETPAPAPVAAEPIAPPPEAWAPMPAARRERVPEPALDSGEDPLDADMRAAEYIAKGDPRAAQAALVAARHFIANGHTNAASDLLLQLIASGLADHQAQRLLVDVVTSLGKRDVARAKCALLAEALRLDGQDELAVEVERLAGAV
jgi:thioredoxin-like negative regulator of GroEL